MGNSQSTSALRPEIWSKELWQDVQDKLFFNVMGMTAKGGPNDQVNGVIHVMDDLEKKQGDTLAMGLTAKLPQSSGVTGDSELEGNESTLTPYSFTFKIDQWRDAVRLIGRLDEQKNSYDMREDAKNKLSIRIREMIEKQVFLKLGGVTNASLVDVNGVAYTGTFNDGSSVATWSNSPTAIPDADTAAGSGNRYLSVNSSGADAQGASDIMTPQIITRMKIKAQLASPRIDPVEYKGKSYYILLVHPWVLADLRDNATFAQALRDAWWRGEDNPLFSGADLVWDDVIVISHKYAPYLKTSVAGNNFNSTGSGTVYGVDTFRSMLCGKQAAVLAKCEEGPKWEEKSFDYGNKWAISCGFMGGIQKPMFNSKEYGVIVCDSAATAQ